MFNLKNYLSKIISIICALGFVGIAKAQSPPYITITASPTITPLPSTTFGASFTNLSTSHFVLDFSFHLYRNVAVARQPSIGINSRFIILRCIFIFGRYWSIITTRGATYCVRCSRGLNHRNNYEYVEEYRIKNIFSLLNRNLYYLILYTLYICYHHQHFQNLLYHLRMFR